MTQKQKTEMMTMKIKLIKMEWMNVKNFLNDGNSDGERKKKKRNEQQ